MAPDDTTNPKPKVRRRRKPVKPVPTNVSVAAMTRADLKAELLLEVSNRLASTRSLDEQLSGIVELTCRALNADRGAIFLNDPATDELYTRITQGSSTRVVRMLNSAGIAGTVFTEVEGIIVDEPYEDERFNQAVDKLTGYKTDSLVVAPVTTIKGEVLGVIECLNKNGGKFSNSDLDMLVAMGTQASIVLQSSLYILKMDKVRKLESEFLEVVADVSSEIQLGPLLQKIMAAVTRMLDSDRSTLFLNDEKTNELYTEIGQGLGATRIRFPNNVGIAGTVFTTGNTINIPYAYADLRFNPSFDKKTGYFTRSILCIPVTNKDGKRIGVTQVLNKRGGAFSNEDEARLRAFSGQIAIGLENAKLFDDVQRMKNYSESILQSMSNGVVTLDDEDRIVTCNAAGERILRARTEQVVGKTAAEFFTGENSWVAERVERVKGTGQPDILMDKELVGEGEPVSVNLTALQLKSEKEGALGSLLLLEDISTEKRVKSTMARYVDPAVADRLLESGEDILGGQSLEVTVLFSDIRSFTTLTEALGAQGTVALLNEYFTIMVEIITNEGGMLDKFIGDAMMAVFGTPFTHEDDPDRGMRAAIDMMVQLNDYNTRLKARGSKPIDHGVGLNTGNVVSGNIGSPKRMDYTVIGDGVNLAARLESACKQYGAHILISEFTHAQVKGTYRTREVDRVIVKGKTEPVGVFEVLDYHTEESFPHASEVINHFRDGVTHYRSQRWKDAVNEFEQVLGLNPNDKASKLYIDRCALLKADPPPEDWAGVWVMKSK